MSRAIVNVPSSVRRGEIIEIKTMVAHVMETGFRRTQLGEIISRNIITEFACRYNGSEIFRASLYPAIAANPVLTFTTVATESGTLEFTWQGDNGYSATASATITVT
jgi:sulfur-oxidizing protein SoxZ